MVARQKNEDGAWVPAFRFDKKSHSGCYSSLPETLPDNVRVWQSAIWLATGAGRRFRPGGTRRGVLSTLPCAGVHGGQVQAAELLWMGFRSFRYYVKNYNLR